MNIIITNSDQAGQPGEIRILAGPIGAALFQVGDDGAWHQMPGRHSTELAPLYATCGVCAGPVAASRLAGGTLGQPITWLHLHDADWKGHAHHVDAHDLWTPAYTAGLLRTPYDRLAVLTT